MASDVAGQRPRQGGDEPARTVAEPARPGDATRPTEEPPPRPRKSASAFRTISEVAEDLHVPQHVLRFWESKFPQIKPLKRGGGRRYYRPDDIALLRRIGDLLYVQGYTIKGVQRVLREGADGEPAEDAAEAPALTREAVILECLDELEEIARDLRACGAGPAGG